MVVAQLVADIPDMVFKLKQGTLELLLGCWDGGLWGLGGLLGVGWGGMILGLLALTKVLDVCHLRLGKAVSNRRHVLY